MASFFHVKFFAPIHPNLRIYTHFARGFEYSRNDHLKTCLEIISCKLSMDCYTFDVILWEGLRGFASQGVYLVQAPERSEGVCIKSFSIQKWSSWGTWGSLLNANLIENDQNDEVAWSFAYIMCEYILHNNSHIMYKNSFAYIMCIHYVRICSAHYVWIFIHNVWVVLYNIWKIVADIVCNKNTAGVQWHPSSMSSFLHPSTQIWEYILTSLGGLNTVGTTILKHV